jgi:membrane-associated protease RseP (regulator of RpoE activity)
MLFRQRACFIGRGISAGFFAVFLGIAAAEELRPKSHDESSPTPTEIDAWIAELDDNRYLVRERATQNLLNAGEAALDALLEAGNSGKPEPADRALWILRRLGQSSDNDLAIAALEQLIEERGRPLLGDQAQTRLAERTFRACEERLAPLGAVMTLQFEPVDIANFAPVLNVQLGPRWQGTSADLRPLAQLRYQQHFRLNGEGIDDAVVKLFEEKEKLARLELWNSRVTPAAVDALKARHPETVVYVRNEALLGIAAENHAKGVMVQTVETPSAAATAGIVPGDVITTFNGHPIADFDRLTARIGQQRPGDVVEIEILRGDEQKKLAVTLGRWSDRR